MEIEAILLCELLDFWIFRRDIDVSRAERLQQLLSFDVKKRLIVVERPKVLVLDSSRVRLKRDYDFQVLHMLSL